MDILQERYAEEDPWRMLVVCQLLNLTQRSQVEPLLEELFTRWPDAHTMSGASLVELKQFLRRLGNQMTKSTRLHLMSLDWWKWERSGEDLPDAEFVRNLYGCGPYAVDSYNYFVLKDYSKFESGDRVLAAWRRWKGLPV